MRHVILLCLVTAGCATRYVVMESSALSVTKEAVPEQKSLVAGEPIAATFCGDETPAYSKNPKEYALVDEAIYRAQVNGNADFIMDAKVERDGHCAIVTGKIARLN